MPDDIKKFLCISRSQTKTRDHYIATDFNFVVENVIREIQNVRRVSNYYGKHN
jgi:hypothetical protein